MPKKTLHLIAVNGVIALLACGNLQAATPDSLDRASQQLTTQAESFRKDQTKKTLTPGQKPEIIQKNKPEPAEKIEGPRFLIKKIILEGNTIYPTSFFEKNLSAYENKETSFAELAELADKITGAYHEAGYLTSLAYIPPQKIIDHQLVIKIVEGKISGIQVEGNKYFKSSIYSDAIHLRSDKIFRYQDLESSLYFLNQKPDLQARGYIVAGKELETSDIVLKAEEKNPIHAYYDFNNRGTKLTNRERHEIHFDDNNLFGFGDTLNTSFSTTEQKAFDAGFISYEFPIESTGTTLHLDTSMVTNHLIGDFEDFKVKGKSLSVFPSVTQNLFRSLEFVADWFLGFDYTDSKTIVSGIVSNFDKMRVLKSGPRLSFQDTMGRTLFSADADWGIPDFLGGSSENDPQASRVNSGGDFLFYTASIARIQRLPDTMYLVLRAGGQWTRDTLTSVEEFHAGGAFSVRGYPESEASGDYGYNFSAELNLPVPFLAKDVEVPGSKKKLWDALRLVTFVDGAKTYLREKSLITTTKDNFLLGTGFGVRFNLDENVSFQCDFGWPIGDDSSEHNRVQTHMALKVGF